MVLSLSVSNVSYLAKNFSVLFIWDHFYNPVFKLIASLLGSLFCDWVHTLDTFNVGHLCLIYNMHQIFKHFSIDALLLLNGGLKIKSFTWVSLTLFRWRKEGTHYFWLDGEDLSQDGFSLSSLNWAIFSVMLNYRSVFDLNIFCLAGLHLSWSFV